MSDEAKKRMLEAADVIGSVNAATARAAGIDVMRKHDLAQIDRMSRWRYPRGALSREMLALMDRVAELEAEVKKLRADGGRPER